MGSSLVRLPFKLAQIHTPEPAGAFITHCHAADCTQGFPSTLCKCTVEDKRQNVTPLEEVGALALDPDTVLPTAPVQCLVVAATDSSLCCYCVVVGGVFFFSSPPPPLRNWSLCSLICCLLEAAGPETIYWNACN